MANEQFGRMVYDRAYAYARKQGAADADARRFATASTAIAHEESGWNPNQPGDNGNSWGLFQNHLQGRGSGYTPAQLRDPETNIAISLPELWQHYQTRGRSGSDLDAVVNVSKYAQRPAEWAWRQAIDNGTFAHSLQAAQAVAGGTSGDGPKRVAPRQSAPRRSQRNGKGPWSGIPGAAPIGVARPGDGDIPTNPDGSINFNDPRINDLVYRGEPLQARYFDQRRGWRLPAQGQVTSLFGTPYELDSGYAGRAHFNKGIDLGASPGSQVVSMTDGVVESVGDSGDGWGPHVRVRDADGYVHNYGHVEGVVRPGQRIAAGTPIARVASAGGTSSGPHVSYDIWQETAQGKRFVDPTPWLAASDKAASAYDPAVANDPEIRRLTGVSGAKSSAGGRRMAGSSTQRSNAVRAAENNVNRLQTQIDANDRAIAALKKQGANPSGSGDADFQLADLIDAQDKLSGRLNSALTTLANVTKEGNDPTVMRPSDRISALNGLREEDNLDASANRDDLNIVKEIRAEGDAAYKAEQDYWGEGVKASQQMFSDNKDVARLIFDVFKERRADAVDVAKQALDQGKATSEAVARWVDASAKQQAAEVARAGAVLNRAKYISDENWKIANRILPAGQQYVDGFGPDSPLNQVFARMGLNPQILRPTRVPRAMLDPEAILQRSGDYPLPRPDIPVDAAREAALGVAGIEPYQGTDFSGIGDVVGSLEVPDYTGMMADYPQRGDGSGRSDYLAGMLGRGGGSDARRGYYDDMLNQDGTGDGGYDNGSDVGGGAAGRTDDTSVGGEQAGGGFTNSLGRLSDTVAGLTGVQAPPGSSSHAIRNALLGAGAVGVGGASLYGATRVMNRDRTGRPITSAVADAPGGAPPTPRAEVVVLPPGRDVPRLGPGATPMGPATGSTMPPSEQPIPARDGSSVPLLPEGRSPVIEMGAAPIPPERALVPRGGAAQAMPDAARDIARAGERRATAEELGRVLGTVGQRLGRRR